MEHKDIYHDSQSGKVSNENVFFSNATPQEREHCRLVNPVYQTALARFPALETALYQKLDDGFKILDFSYEGNEKTGHEQVRIILLNGYERFLISQSKGVYAGGYSHVTFGREDEIGTIL